MTYRELIDIPKIPWLDWDERFSVAPVTKVAGSPVAAPPQERQSSEEIFTKAAADIADVEKEM